MSAFAEIDLAALKNNYRALGALAPGVARICVLKANAYGHGAAECLAALYAAGARRFALSSAGEVLSLLPLFRRLSAQKEEKTGQAGAFPGVLFLLGPCEEAEVLALLRAVRELDFPFFPLHFSVHALGYARRLSRILAEEKAKGALPADFFLPIHIKVETGMNRLGFSSHAAMCTALSLPSLRGVGLYSHFGAADDPDSGRTALQTVSFFRTKESLREKGFSLFCHLSAGAATLRFGALGQDGIRAGILLYGISPFSLSPKPLPAPFAPVMRLCAKVLQVKTVKAGEWAGYGSGAFREDRRVAVLDIGYADGLPRAALGAHIHLAGGLVPLCGSVCMDRCFADVGQRRVRVGDTATLFGAFPGDTERFAAERGLSPYELLSLHPARLALRYRGKTGRDERVFKKGRPAFF